MTDLISDLHATSWIKNWETLRSSSCSVNQLKWNLDQLIVYVQCTAHHLGIKSDNELLLNYHLTEVVQCWNNTPWYLTKLSSKHTSTLCHSHVGPHLPVKTTQSHSLVKLPLTNMSHLPKERHQKDLLRQRRKTWFQKTPGFKHVEFNLLTRRKKKRWKYRSKRRRRDSGRSWAVTEL